jgi:hypothetical protein
MGHAFEVRARMWCAMRLAYRWRVSRPYGPVVHKGTGIFGRAQMTACGLRVQRGWVYWMPRKHVKFGDVFGKECKRCSNALVRRKK